MGLFSSLFKLIKAIIKKIVAAVKKLVKAIWPLLLIVAAVYFAPVIGSFFTSVGMPSIGAFFTSTVGSLTAPMTGWLSSLWGGVTSLAGTAWTAFKGLEFGTQLAAVTGAAALLAPEETADVISEVGVVVGDVVGELVGGVASGLPTWVWLAGAVTLFLLFSRRKEDEYAV